ncbi:uncharacterized protein [Equus caballus]|uniref:uncharacterized protein n=1 Tax=Equus caballus TaxID=9796 RepID=UPI0038B374C2
MSPSQPLPTYCLSCSPSSSFLHSFDPCSGRVAWAPYIWIVNWFPSEVSGYLSRGPLSPGLRRMGQLLVWILSAPTMLTPWLMTESVTETPCDREQHSWDLKQLTHHVTQGPPPPDQGQPFCQWSVPCSNHSRVASLCNLSPLGHRMDRVVICEEFLYLTQDGTQLQSFALDKNSVLMDGYSPNRNNALTENSGKLQESPSPGWEGNILMLCVKENHAHWVLNDDESWPTRVKDCDTVRGQQEPWRNDRSWLSPALITLDFPFWAIILIYLVGLLVLITCLLCGLLVSRVVLFVFFLLGCKSSCYIINICALLGICLADSVSHWRLDVGGSFRA